MITTSRAGGEEIRDDGFILTDIGTSLSSLNNKGSMLLCVCFYVEKERKDRSPSIPGFCVLCPTGYPTLMMKLVAVVLML